MDNRRQVSMAVIRRLPKYQRYLFELMKNDVDRISSKELSKRIGFTASQIRQDLNNFGDFGQQGYGYNVRELYNEIQNILGLNTAYKTIIIGVGNLGQAIANYTNFDRLGFNLQALFDINPKLIGLKIRDIEIHDIDSLSSFTASNHIDIAIICTPSTQAQRLAEKVAEAGINAIWNFAPVDLFLPEEIIVENVHLSESLLTLAYKINEPRLLKGIKRISRSDNI